jgi:Zn-dependent protease with chaperone function
MKIAVAIAMAMMLAWGGQDSGTAPDDFHDQLRPVPIPAPSALAVQYHRTGNWLWGVTQVWTLAVPALILFSGLSGRLRDLARRIGRKWFFTIGVYWLLFTAIAFGLTLPLSYYLGFVRQHAYGLSTQSFGRWSGNELKELAIEMVAGFLLLWIPFLVIARSPRRWWLYTTVLTVPLEFFVMLVAPIWIDPLFNDFGPMKDHALEQKIDALAERAGISGSRIFEVNKSVDTRALNAYVKGFMGTKRIVLYDTLLAKLDEKEVLAVLGHEMGHYALGHITRSILLSALAVLLSLFLVDRAGRWLTRRWSPRFGFESLSDVASLPLLLILVQLTGLGLAPVVLAYSRYQEHQADGFALELTHTNRSAALAFAKLQQENLGVPWRSPFETLWRASHPSIGERITYCNDYHPWTEGRPLRFGAYFRPGGEIEPGH